jgi:hypothetical protein
MSEPSTKKLLMDIAEGNASPEDLSPKEDDIDYSKFTTDELKWFYSNDQQYGDNVLTWPLKERVELLKILRDLPNRKSWTYGDQQNSSQA